MMMFNSWYDKNEDKAKSIEILIEKFKISGNKDINAAVTKKKDFSAKEWNSFNEEKANSFNEL